MIYIGWANNIEWNQICSPSKFKTLNPEWFYEDWKKKKIMYSSCLS